MPNCTACEMLKYDQLINAKTKETGIRIYPPKQMPKHTCEITSLNDDQTCEHSIKYCNTSSNVKETEKK
jgi:hypothetical protein